MRRGPLALGLFVTLALLCAVPAYFGLVFIYNWELTRVGLLAGGEPLGIFLRTFTFHSTSFGAWLALACAAAVAVHRIHSAAAIAAAEALARERRAAEELERERKDRRSIMSSLSHDFRTPLAGILSFSEMIRDENLTVDEIKEFAATIYATTRRLDGTIAGVVAQERNQPRDLLLV